MLLKLFILYKIVYRLQFNVSVFAENIVVVTLIDLVMLALAALNPPAAAVDPAVDPPCTDP